MGDMRTLCMTLCAPCTARVYVVAQEVVKPIGLAPSTKMGSN
jgi:hypothetical protein